MQANTYKYRYNCNSSTCNGQKHTEIRLEAPTKCVGCDSTDISNIVIVETYTGAFPETIGIKTAEAEGDTLKINSFNFADKTTWYQGALLITGETLTTSDDLTFNAVHDYFINPHNLTLISQENKMLAVDGSLKSRHYWCIKVYIDGVQQDEFDGYSVDYTFGKITFDSSQAGKVITCDYYYASSSKYIIKPPAGKDMLIIRTRLTLSQNATFDNSACNFDLFGGWNLYYPPEVTPAYPTGDENSPFNGFAFRYRCWSDFICNCDEYHHAPAVGDMTMGTVDFHFKYDRVIRLKSSMAHELHLSLLNDVPPQNCEIGILMASMIYVDSE